ncbi:MAG: hypothetical protein CM1200mP41_21440 [Gammaproteobacteria bacterium]|nr:MAG: hypothetical protein CM1200mP41_21440 [Gammaproteobacteria bacterium]
MTASIDRTRLRFSDMRVIWANQLFTALSGALDGPGPRTKSPVCWALRSGTCCCRRSAAGAPCEGR